MRSYIDCGMHLVFHGVVATCVSVMEDFITDHGLTQQFERLANHYLQDIQSLRLEWCKMKQLPKTQWLAENELGYARVMPFICGLFFHNLELPKRTCTRPATVTVVKQMFHSLHVMVCILMSPRDPGPTEIDGHVKVFLSCCHRFARSYYATDAVPFWSTKGNFPTLLLLAEQRRRHGPVRWYWEGTSERFIQQLKKPLTSMQKITEHFTKKLALVHKSVGIDWI